MNDWTYILLSHPEKPPMRLNQQPEPKPFVHLGQEGGDVAAVFSLIGSDKSGHVAFFVYGSWDFGDPDSFFTRD